MTQRHRDRGTEKEREREKQTEREKERERERQTDRQTDRERQREKQTERERDRDRERAREIVCHLTTSLRHHRIFFYFTAAFKAIHYVKGTLFIFISLRLFQNACFSHPL